MNEYQTDCSRSLYAGRSVTQCNFCHAMLCISAAYAVVRCLSGWVSVCHVRVLCLGIAISDPFSQSRDHSGIEEFAISGSHRDYKLAEMC